MKLSQTLYLQRFIEVVIIIMVNGVLLLLANHDSIPFIVFLTLLLNSLLLYLYSFTWLHEIWAKETCLTISLFGIRKTYNYQDLKIISEANYSFRFLFKIYTPIKLTFRNKMTIVFIPQNDGLENLLNIVKKRSLQVKIELASSQDTDR